MHWGLTTFERKRIERIALDHPFFDMHPQLLTRKELRAVLAQGPRKSGPQVIAEVRKELGMIYAPDCQNQRTFAEALRDVSFVPSFRRTVAVVALCLLMIFFMVFTVPGRAFAEELYSIVIEFTDGLFGAYNNIPSENSAVPDFTSLPQDIGTLQELAELLNCPLYACDDELIGFEYDVESSSVLVVTSRYETENGQSYAICQEYYGSSTFWGASVEAERNSVQFSTPIGIEMYVDQSEDGTVYAIGFHEMYMIYVSSRDISTEDLKTILHEMHRIE